MITDDEIRALIGDRRPAAPLAPQAVRRRARTLRRRRRTRRVGASAVALAAVGAAALTLPPSSGAARIQVAPAAGGPSQAELPAQFRLPSGSVPLRVSGLHAWTDSDGVCYGQGPAEPQYRVCVQDVQTDLAQGWDLYRGVGGSIVHEPVVRATFFVRGRAVPAQVVGFASHPVWRIIIADLKAPESAGNHIVLRGWDASGRLVVTLGCDGPCVPPPSPAGPQPAATGVTASLQPASPAVSASRPPG